LTNIFKKKRSIVKVRRDGTMYIESKDFYKQEGVQNTIRKIKGSGILEDIKKFRQNNK